MTKEGSGAETPNLAAMTEKLMRMSWERREPG